MKYSSRGESLYFDSMWQVQTDAPTLRQSKHIYVGQSRVATQLNIAGHLDVGYEMLNTYYYHPDHLGSSQLVSDYQGKEYERVEYSPYGESWIDKESDSFNLISYKFTGKELDSETGLYYYGARYLNPKTSRWASADPAMGEYLPEAPNSDEARKRNGNLPGGGVFSLFGLAVYGYASNNPLRYTDPSGAIPVDAVAARASEENVQVRTQAQTNAIANPNYQPNAGGDSATHCNEATYDVAQATGVRSSVYLGDRPRGEVSANAAFATLAAGSSSPAGVPVRGGRVELSGEQAQSMANQGWTVFAGWFNPESGGHGHIASVASSTGDYDPAQGPMVANAGPEGFMGGMSTRQAFGRAYERGEVHFYYDPQQALPSSRRQPEE